MTNDKDKRRSEHVIKMDDQNMYTTYAEHKPRKNAKTWFNAAAYKKHPICEEK